MNIKMLQETHNPTNSSALANSQVQNNPIILKEQNNTNNNIIQICEGNINSNYFVNLKKRETIKFKEREVLLKARLKILKSEERKATNIAKACLDLKGNLDNLEIILTKELFEEAKLAILTKGKEVLIKTNDLKQQRIEWNKDKNIYLNDSKEFKAIFLTQNTTIEENIYEHEDDETVEITIEIEKDPEREVDGDNLEIPVDNTVNRSIDLDTIDNDLEQENIEEEEDRKKGFKNAVKHEKTEKVGFFGRLLNRFKRTSA